MSHVQCKLVIKSVPFIYHDSFPRHISRNTNFRQVYTCFFFFLSLRNCYWLGYSEWNGVIIVGTLIRLSNITFNIFYNSLSHNFSRLYFLVETNIKCRPDRHRLYLHNIFPIDSFSLCFCLVNFNGIDSRFVLNIF